MRSKKYLTIPELATLLGVSRIAIYKRVKRGEIKAKKIGRNFAVPRSYLQSFLGRSLGEEEKKAIDQAVHKTVEEYGEVLKLLGKE